MDYKQGEKIEYDGVYYYVMRDEGDVLWITDITEDVGREFASGWYISKNQAERVEVRQ